MDTDERKSPAAETETQDAKLSDAELSDAELKAAAALVLEREANRLDHPETRRQRKARKPVSP